MPSLDDIEQALLARAAGSPVDDLGKIATALKDVADARCAELTARNQGREVRLALFKSIVAFLTPLVALGTMFATIVNQNEQIAAGRQQVEDTEWRDLLTSLKGASDSVSSDVTVAPRLRSFFKSPVYGGQAKAIAGRLMGHISNPEGFRDLFTTVYGDADRQNVDAVLDIGRTLVVSRQSLQLQCNDLLFGAGIPYDPVLLDCGLYVDEKRAREAITRLKVPAQFARMHQSDVQLGDENRFLDTRIVAFLRANYRIPRDPAAPPLDLSGEYIVAGDLSGLDLTGFKIAGTTFDGVTFNGAILAPKGRTGQSPTDGEQQPDFRGSTWWDARFIEPSLLSFLIRWYYPYLRSDVLYPPGYGITRQAYQAKVTALCAAANLVCPLPLPFGTP